MPSQADTLRPLWTAADRDPLPTIVPRDGESVDLAIVGAGFQGLSAALHAARRGLSVLVLEQATVGSGASGLNGGQVIPGLKYDPERLLDLFGERRGGALVAFAAGTADHVFGLIEREALPVPFQRSGWIQAAHTAGAMKAAADRHRQWTAIGASARMLDAGQVADLTGAAGYLGGWLDLRAGVVDPLALAVEMARTAIRSGARVAEGTRVTGLGRSAGRWTLRLQTGSAIHAAKVLLATHAYTDALLPGLARSIVPLHSFQVATAPLPEALARQVLPQGQAVSDSRRILVYYRKSPDGRLMVGGRGRMSETGEAADWRHVERALVRLYPALRGVAIERRWFGRVAMTPDHLPHVYEPEPGLVAVAGCQGRGVALMTALGPGLAEYLATGDPDALPLPRGGLQPIPFHRLRRIGVAAAIAWFRLRDAMER